MGLKELCCGVRVVHGSEGRGLKGRHCAGGMVQDVTITPRRPPLEEKHTVCQKVFRGNDIVDERKSRGLYASGQCETWKGLLEVLAIMVLGTHLYRYLLPSCQYQKRRKRNFQTKHSRYPQDPWSTAYHTSVLHGGNLESTLLSELK